MTTINATNIPETARPFALAWNRYISHYRDIVTLDNKLSMIESLGYLDALEFTYPKHKTKIRKEKSVIIPLLFLSLEED